MDVFALRNRVIDDYREYITSFMSIRDERIQAEVDENIDNGLLWPEPRIGLNPAFETGGLIDEHIASGLLHAECSNIFRIKNDDGSLKQPMTLHRHQLDAIKVAQTHGNYVLTTGTGSGKSLSYIVPIVDRVLKNGSGKGIKAIIVYPMNALANSQEGELTKFLKLGYAPGGEPVRFERYTGQESEEKRLEIIANPPDILLTNYVMLELILTRVDERQLVEQAKGLEFLVFDELHTYRGRQGADVALLARRVREACEATKLQVVGTSATMSSGGTFADQQAEVARVASMLFGSPVPPENVIGETLRRSTAPFDGSNPTHVSELRERLLTPPGGPFDLASFTADPLSRWIEATFGIRVEEPSGRLVRTTPRTVRGSEGAADELAALIDVPANVCAEAIEDQLMLGNSIQQENGFPVFAFRLHQFISRGDTVYASLEDEESRYITVNPQQFVPGERDRVLLPNPQDKVSWSRQSLISWISDRIIELTYTAWDLQGFGVDVGYHGPPFRWDPARRELLRAELDAAFFHLYGIERADVDYIMDTFPIVKRKDEAAHGEYRTKQLILERYDSLASAAAAGTEYQTVLNPPPADPSCAHPESTRPAWA